MSSEVFLSSPVEIRKKKKPQIDDVHVHVYGQVSDRLTAASLLLCDRSLTEAGDSLLTTLQMFLRVLQVFLGQTSGSL